VTGAVVAGTGFGCYTHVRALRAAGFDVLAVIGRDPAKTRARADAFDVPRALTSFDDALALAGVDAVTIATPPVTHAPMVMAAIAAGKHVLCEKPFGRDTAEAEKVRAAADEAGIVHLLGTEFRFDTGQALLARVVHDGAIGEPRLGLFLLHVPVLAAPDAEIPVWWGDPAQGGGWLGAHGSQVIDQIRVTMGEIVSVDASLVHIGRHRWKADDGFVAQLRLASGATVLMQSTAADWGPPLVETRVIGSAGTAAIDGLGERVFLSDAHGTRRVDVPPELRTSDPSPPPPETLTTTYEAMIGHGLDLGPYTRLAEHFLARIRGVDAPPGPAPATFADGVADMAVLDAIRRAAASGGTATVA
jgi:predicted dehydrogenase